MDLSSRRQNREREVLPDPERSDIRCLWSTPSHDLSGGKGKEGKGKIKLLYDASQQNHRTFGNIFTNTQMSSLRTWPCMVSNHHTIILW